jgi:hypothetical protein
MRCLCSAVIFLRAASHFLEQKVIVLHLSGGMRGSIFSLSLRNCDRSIWARCLKPHASSENSSQPIASTGKNLSIHLRWPIRGNVSTRTIRAQNGFFVNTTRAAPPFGWRIAHNLSVPASLKKLSVEMTHLTIFKIASDMQAINDENETPISPPNSKTKNPHYSCLILYFYFIVRVSMDSIEKITARAAVQDTQGFPARRVCSPLGESIRAKYCHNYFELVI